MSQTEAATHVSSREDDVILEVRDASVDFKMDRGRSRVLDDINIDVQRGEVLGVVGESGSGKSMFAAALLDAVVEPGLLHGDITYYPDESEPIEVLDLRQDKLRQFRWNEVSMVFQGALASFNPTIRIGAHFRETLEVHGVSIEEGMSRAEQLLTELHLEPERILESYAHELSGGMKQRTLIALSLVLEPEVLVLDEPTAALDLLMQRSILSLLDDLQARYDLTLVFITHDLPLIADLADRIAVMYAFEFVELGTTEEIILESAHPYTRSLINSTPNLETPVDLMRPIEGESPDPVNIPEGCSYHTRCPLADAHCKNVDPELTSAWADHEVACHHWEEVDHEIPLSIQEIHNKNTNEQQRSVPSEGTQSSEVVVSLEDVHVHFTVNDSLVNPFVVPETVRAVDGIDLEIYEQDVVVLVGESGCGKTTLGKTAVALQEATDGTLLYRGQDVTTAKRAQSRFSFNNEGVSIPYPEIRRALQIIHQDPGSSLNPNKTVLSSLESPLKIWQKQLSSEDRRVRIFGMLDRVGMSPPEDYASRYPHQLSGGEKQRVALIRALLMNPDLILADEAVSALDVSLRVDMMDLMLELQDIFDTSYLFISHNLSNARYIAESAGGRIGIMYLGQIVEIGTAETILEDPIHPYTKALKMVTPKIDPATEVEDPPIRSIDIPDPIDPPPGCRFHTRCPEARQICREQSPPLEHADDDSRRVACFRGTDDHPYWDSQSIVEEE